MPVSFELFKSYNFNTLAPTILATNYKNVKVLSIMNHDTALKYFVPATTSASVFPFLPIGTVSDPTKYTYILFESNDSLKTVLALEWIDQSTITVVSYQTLTLTVTQAAAGDADKIKQSLLLLGITNFTLTSS